MPLFRTRIAVKRVKHASLYPTIGAIISSPQKGIFMDESGREPSRAYPASYYRDPAESVRFDCEFCEGCKWERHQAQSGAKWCALKKRYGLRCQEYQPKGHQ